MKIFFFIFRSYMLHKIHASMNIYPLNRNSFDIYLGFIKKPLRTSVLFIDTQTYNVS